MSNKWQTLSANERYIEIDGRHFFACRCSRNPKAGWMIEELDNPIYKRPKVLRGIGAGVPTRQISVVVENYIKSGRQSNNPSLTIKGLIENGYLPEV